MSKTRADNDIFEPDYEYCPRCYANLTLQKEKETLEEII